MRAKILLDLTVIGGFAWALFLLLSFVSESLSQVLV